MTKSSRKRNMNRANRYVKSAAAVYYRLNPKTQKEMLCANRPKRRAEAAAFRRKMKHANQS